MTEPSTTPGSQRDPIVADDEAEDAAQDWFLRCQAGPLSAAEQARFEAWCAADPRHPAAYREVAALWADIDALEPAFAPRGREGEVPVAQRPVAAASGVGRWRRFAPAAGGLLAAGLLLLLFAPGLSHFPTRLLADHGTAIGEQRRIDLPDGSVAILDTDSAIDVAFADGRRVVTLLQGRAWFEVKKDASRPFDVVAAGGRTTAIGTAFVVDDDGPGATVTVTEGTVRVSSPDVDGALAAESTIVLDAGQQVSYRRGAAPAGARSVDPAGAAAWRHGIVVIRDRTLGDALAEIGRYRGGRIVLLGNDTRYTRVTARLALSDLDAGLAALAATHGLAVTHITDWLLIVH